jgi:hypothetical protein
MNTARRGDFSSKQRESLEMNSLLDFDHCDYMLSNI